MKLKTQSQLSRINRSAKQLSIGGLIGLALLTSSAVGQDVAPGFAPGSIPDGPSSVLFSLLEESAEPVVVSPADVPVEQSGVWSPPATQVSVSAPAWNPPNTPVPTPVPTPAVKQVDELEDELLDQPSPSDAPVPTSEVPQAIENEVSQVRQELSTPTMESLPSEVPRIPVTPEIMIQENQSVSPSLSLEAAVDGSGQNVIANEFADQATTESVAVVNSFEAEDFFNETPTAAGSKPVLTPVRNILGGVSSRLAGDGSVHATGQLTFLSLARDYRGKGRLLSNGVPNLSANGPDEGDFTGVDINYGRRRSNGEGWEMRFMGFDPDAAVDVSGSGPSLAWGGIVAPLTDPNTPATYGLSGIGLNGFSMADVFDDAGYHRVTRDSQFGSFEYNLLRAGVQGSQLSCGNKSSVEFFGGLRAVTIDESIAFTAGATQSAVFPNNATYTSEVKNALFGLQVGGRLERQLSKGWGYTFGTRVGIYNNRVESRQSAQYRFADGSTATPQVLFGNDAGREFDFSGKDNELAFLGELDFGVVYQFRPRTRARVGFRGIAVTNIADAAGQFEDSLFDIEAVAEPKAFSDFIVGGLYFGVDYAF